MPRHEHFNNHQVKTMKNKAITSVLIFLALSYPLFTQAETRYVTDQFEITLRSGPSGKNTIQRMVRSGTALEVLERDKETGYSRVRTTGGTEGWVLTRYLIREPAARAQLEKLTKQLTQTTAKGSSIRSQLDSIKNEHQTARQRIQELENQNKRLQDELEQIKRTAADVLTINMQNKTLTEQLDTAQAQVAELEAENGVLNSAKDKEWFITGAGVLFGGLLLGLIIPKIQWQRRNRYGGF